MGSMLDPPARDGMKRRPEPYLPHEGCPCKAWSAGSDDFSCYLGRNEV